MKLIDQVCTLEQAKKLSELGVYLRTIWYWNLNHNNGEYYLSLRPNEDGEFYPAPTSSELGILLPKFIIFEEYRYWLSLDNITTEFGVSYKIDNHLLNSEFLGDKNFYESSEAQARAEAFIWLIDNKFIFVENLTL